MNTVHRKWTPLILMVGAILGAACNPGGEDSPEALAGVEPAGDASVHPANLPDGVLPLGRFEFHYDHETKQLTSRRVTQATNLSAGAAVPGVSPQGFVQFGPTVATYSTIASAVGPDPSFDGGAGCAAGRFCAIVDMSSPTASRTIENVYAQIASVSPSGIVGANSDAVPTGYPLDASLGLWSFGDLPVGHTNQRRWDFSLPTPTSFTYVVDTFGTLTPSDYGIGADTIGPANNTLDNSGTFRNACASPIVQIPGSPILALAAPGSDNLGSEIALPFPFSFYDYTFDTDDHRSLLINTNGIVGLTPVGNATNVTLPDSSGSYAYSMMPFWDQLTVGPSGICVGTEGTHPSRKFVVTWPDATVTGSEKLTFSLVLSEGTDRIEFQYSRWSTSRTNCTSTGTIPALGYSATVGLQGPGGAGELWSYNARALPAHPPSCPGPGFRLIYSVSAGGTTPPP
jgi:hypothetical protein